MLKLLSLDNDTLLEKYQHKKGDVKRQVKIILQQLKQQVARHATSPRR
jgi:hypothetical protein